MKIEYKALMVREIEPNIFKRSIEILNTKYLNSSDVLINVKYSSLNYKDALSSKGHKGITRNYPFTPGIDASGVVVFSKVDDFQIGDEVLVTGYDLGMNTFGGFGEYISVPADWIVKLPYGLDLKTAMMYGTAGFTVGVCLNEFDRHNVSPEKGKILVTGATGGVGSLAVAILSKIGYEVTASTRKVSYYDYLYELGAKEVISSDDIFDNTGRPLLSGKWAGMIDNVGGEILSSAIKSIKQRGCVCILGNTLSDKFDATVYPFLLRGISLAGIDSASRLKDERIGIWNNIATKWNIQDKLPNIIKEVALEQLSDEIDVILNGGQIGRVLVRVS